MSENKSTKHKALVERWSADDRRLVRALIDDDGEAWSYVMTELVAPLIRANIRGVAEMFARYSIPADALPGKLYMNLKCNDFAALRNFRYECRFSSFLFWRVYSAAQSLVRESSKNFEFLLSDEAYEDAPTTQKDSSQTTLLNDEIVHTNRLLARLWEQNPTHALILLLRNDLGLSSKTVGAFLGKTVNNVDQINIRAQKTMRRFRDEE